MITRDWLVMMARYNAWQNRAQISAASSLSDAQRREDLGAFFKSIHGTLNHILWADQMWLSRFGACAAPRVTVLAQSVTLCDTWDELTAERSRVDAVIGDWSATVDAAALEGDLTWLSGATGREMTRPRAMLATHLFNHQTHHRGQVNAMLTRLGVSPGITDLPFQPD